MAVLIRANPKTGEAEAVIPQDRLVIQFKDGSFLKEKFKKLSKEFIERKDIDKTTILEFLKLMLKDQYKNVEGITVDNIGNYLDNEETDEESKGEH